MRASITKITLSNFCKFYGTSKVDETIDGDVVVTGKNATGKSTIKRAIQYVLNCRDERGKEIVGIRPHDKNGADIDNVESVDCITFNVDGVEKELKKVHRQDFNKKGEFKGNITECYVNDIPKKSSDYQTFLDETFAPSEQLQYCINANALLSKSGSDQRIILENTFGAHSDEDICDAYPEFSELKPMFADGTVRELKDRYNRALNGTRGKSATKGLKQLADEFEPRIDELHGRKTDLDFAELELQKNQLTEELNIVLSYIESAREESSDNKMISSELERLSQERASVAAKASQQYATCEAQYAARKSAYDSIENLISEARLAVDFCKSNIGNTEHELRELFDERKTCCELVFDDASLVCPTCQREYDESKKGEIRAEFERKKEERIAAIDERIREKEEHISSSKELLEKREKELGQRKEALVRANVELTEAKNALANYSTRDSYVKMACEKIDAEIIKNRAKLSEQIDDDKLIELKAKEQEVRANLTECEKKIALNAVNIEIDDRIEELRKEQRAVQQKIADQERILDLLKDFERKKNELLTADVNNYLEFCEVKMFRPLINGDLEECCEFVVGGESYSRNLNHGDRILAEVDICRAFQKKVDIEIPIIVDDGESLDKERIPDIPNQLIFLRLSEDDTLRFEQ